MKKLKIKNFLAAVLFKSKRPLKIVKLDLPKYLSKGQVLVKIHYSGICGSQIGEIDASKGKDKYLPHLLGHEGSGTVLEVGPGVKTVKPKDKVVLHWRPGSGIQSSTTTYKYKKEKNINAGWVTTFNEYSIVSENRVTKVIPKINLLTAPLFGCAITTGFGVINNDAKVKKNESIVIYGAGGIGLNMIQAAKLAKAYPIIAIDIYKKKLSLAKKCGSTHTIDSSEEKNLNSKINKIVKNKLDIFIDNTGIPKIIEFGYQILSKKGKLVLVGVPKQGQKIKIYTLPIHFGKKIIGSEGGSSKPNKDINNIIKILKKNKINLKHLVSKVYSFRQINQAIKDIRLGRIAGRAIIKF